MAKLFRAPPIDLHVKQHVKVGSDGPQVPTTVKPTDAIRIFKIHLNSSICQLENYTFTFLVLYSNLFLLGNIFDRIIYEFYTNKIYILICDRSSKI